MKISDIKGISDSHTHLLEMKKKGISLEDFISNWENNGGRNLIDIGIVPDDFNERLELRRLNNNNNIYYTLGIHPNYASSYPMDSFSILEKQIRNEYVVGVGETGLDYFRGFSDKDIQKAFFEKHIYLSANYNKPIVIHNRDASEEIIDILKFFKNENIKLNGVIHCFSAGKPELKEFLDLGFYISFAGNLTYKKSSTIQEALSYTPLDRLLIETDSPYLSPQKVRGSLNTPCHIGYTLDFICDKLQKKRTDLVDQISSNFNNLFFNRKTNE